MRDDREGGWVVKTVQHYICEVCGTEYKEKVKARECEDRHKQPVKIVSCRYRPITVRMNDGKDVIYKR